MSGQTSPDPTPLPQRLTGVVLLLLGGLNMHARRINMPPAFCGFLAGRLSRLHRRLQFLLTRGPVAPRKPRETPGHATNLAPKTPPKPDAQNPHGFCLPTRFAWLLRMFPGTQVAVARAHLLNILEEPEAQSLIAAHPTLARSLRPLCHMVGLKTPACLARAPRPRRKRPPQPAPASTQKPKPPRQSWFPAPLTQPTPAQQRLALAKFLNPHLFSG